MFSQHHSRLPAICAAQPPLSESRARDSSDTPAGNIIDLGPRFPHPRNAGQLIRAQRWDAVTEALDGWRGSTGADHTYFRRLALFEIAEWKRWEARP